MLCPRCHRDYADDSTFCHYDGEALIARRLVESIPAGRTRYLGEVLGDRYVVRGYIGRGSMSRVYLAEDRETNTPVAVKVLEKMHARDATARDRFMGEARAAQAVHHPNIVSIFDVGQRKDGMPYLVMEFLFGESLGEFLSRETVIRPEIALPVLRQVADGLSAAHAAHVIHRDVKPDNLFLVGEPGDPYAVKLLDFGLAKLSRGSEATAAGLAVGTMEYMAPEQVVTDPIDEFTDIYALGVVMYRMFAGALPFQGQDEGALLAKQLITEPQAPTSRVPELSPDIEAVILRAMQKRPENRYSSMLALLEDLERLLGDRDGELSALEPVDDDDVYRPKTPFARQAATFLYKKLGLPMPEQSGAE